MASQPEIDDNWQKHFQNRLEILSSLSLYGESDLQNKLDFLDSARALEKKCQEDFWRFYCTYGGSRNLFFYLLGMIELDTLRDVIDSFREWYITNREKDYSRLSGSFVGAGFPFDMLLEHFVAIADDLIAALIFEVAWKNKRKIKVFVRRAWNNFLWKLGEAYPFEHLLKERGYPREAIRQLEHSFNEYYSLLFTSKNNQVLLGEMIGESIITELDEWKEVHQKSLDILQTLYASPMTLSELRQNTGLTSIELHAALDCLRNENKLRKIQAKSGEVHWCIWLE